MDASDLELPVDRDELTLGHFIRRVTREHAQREAIVHEGRRLTYADLGEQVERIARALVAAGVGKGSRVALLLGNRPEFVAALHAVGLVGGVTVPVSTFAPPDERDYILRHSDAQVLLMQPALAGNEYLAELYEHHPVVGTARTGALYDPTLPQLRRVVCLEEDAPAGAVETWDDFLADGDRVPAELLDRILDEVHPTDDALIIYTSGSTGRPKAVLHTHQAACVQSWRWVDQIHLTPDDRVWSAFPFFWTAGLSFVVGATLAAGGCLVLQELFEPAEALELLERERVTTVHAWPQSAIAMAEHPDAPKRDLTSLVKVAEGNPLRRFASPEVRLWDPGGAYGASETFTISTSIPSDAPPKLRQETHGVALPGMTVRIVDPETDEEQPTGELGEIAVKGITLMRGYYKVYEEEYLDAEGFFRAHDSGYLDEQGYLHWAGRIDGMIKSGGANVAPVEIDEKLRAWGRLAVGHATGVPHPTLGQAVVVVAICNEDDPVDEDEVREWLRDELAAYKVPRRVVFLREQDLSTTESTKIKFSELTSTAARRLVELGDDPDWVAYLREQHPDLLERPDSALTAND